jgi:hypothetical protein
MSAGSRSVRIACTEVYVIRSLLLITAVVELVPHDRPRRSTSMKHDWTSRSTCGFRLQRPVASSAGNMCTARSGKYTDVLRLVRSRSSALPSCT